MRRHRQHDDVPACDPGRAGLLLHVPHRRHHRGPGRQEADPGHRAVRRRTLRDLCAPGIQPTGCGVAVRDIPDVWSVYWTVDRGCGGIVSY